MYRSCFHSYYLPDTGYHVIIHTNIFVGNITAIQVCYNIQSCADLLV